MNISCPPFFLLFVFFSHFDEFFFCHRIIYCTSVSTCCCISFFFLCYKLLRTVQQRRLHWQTREKKFLLPEVTALYKVPSADCHCLLSHCRAHTDCTDRSLALSLARGCGRRRTAPIVAAHMSGRRRLGSELPAFILLLTLITTVSTCEKGRFNALLLFISVFGTLKKCFSFSWGIYPVVVTS